MDIAINWNPTEMRGDWAITPGDLKRGSDLETAVLVSLFTERVADPDYVAPPGSPQDRHGWWGDTYEIAEGNTPIGSRLWELNRAVKADASSIPNRARDMCREALQWLENSQIVAAVTPAARWLAPGSNVLVITVDIKEPSGVDRRFQYEWAWQGIS